jgi:hypothetical protein
VSAVESVCFGRATAGFGVDLGAADARRVVFVVLRAGRLVVPAARGLAAGLGFARMTLIVSRESL